TAVEVDEVDASGNLVGKVTDLFDDGSATHNDVTAGDGVFNNVSVVGFDTAGQRFFVAKLTDSTTGAALQAPPVTVSGVVPPTAAELQQMLDASRAVSQQAAAALAAGQDPQAVLDSAQATLEASPDQAVPGSVQ